ncbi:MAG: C10 family peptidase [Prevotellaceae bacterium]|jgi:hypothetical protein|nr:C10 family peptidase [Prevotellaceae bacterium]
MKRNLLTLVLVFIAISSIYANPITPNEALQKAKSFSLQRLETGVQRVPASAQDYTLAYSCTRIANAEAPNGVFMAENPFFYVFNKENGGFIIVSGDDRAKDILGYSDSGNFDINNIPDNMRWFLSCYAGEIFSLGVDDNTMPRYNAPANQTVTNEVTSFIQTQWNQDYPYNKFCPPFNSSAGNNYPTGCVATAMAQIMKYYNYPRTGTGSHSYSLPGNVEVFEANFGATTYDWANMLDSYYYETSETQKNAVATLMYHCGVSVDMHYAPEASGAPSSSVSFALKNYFGYDAGVQLLQRSNYTAAQWDNVIKAELDAARPVYYAGDNGESGHAFVCDGYTGDSSVTYFHINWGWGGMADGLFASSALNPGSIGIGGGTGGFNYYQQIIVGIKPAGAYAVLSCNTLQSEGMLVRNQTGNFSFSLTNNNDENYNSVIVLDIAKSDYTSYQRIYQNNNEFIAAGETKVFDNLSANITLAAGSYFFVIQYKRGANWEKLYYVPVMVAANDTKNADLVCNSLQANGEILTGAEGSFTASITNQHNTSAYNSKLVVELLDWSHNQVISQNVEPIAAGETRSINFLSNITLPAGSYFLVVKYDKSNASGTDLDILSYAQIEVKTAAGIVNNEFAEITLYPNPAAEELFVKSEEMIKSITVFDISGKIMNLSQLPTAGVVSIDISPLLSGVYLLKTETVKGAKTLKFYKK